MLARILALLAALAGALVLLGPGDPAEPGPGLAGAAAGRSVEAGSDVALVSDTDAQGPGAEDPGERGGASSPDEAEPHGSPHGLAHPHEIKREERNGRVVVRVLDASTGQPLPEAYVEVRRARGGGAYIRDSNHIGRTSDGLAHLFAVFFHKPHVVEAHHRGHASVRWTTSRTIDLADLDVGSMGDPPFHAKEWVVRLEPCAEHEYLLLDGTTGEPVRDRRVSLHVRDPDDPDRLGEALPWYSQREDGEARTDDDGRLHLVGVPTGEYVLQVPEERRTIGTRPGDPRHGTVEVYPGYEPLELRVPAHGGGTLVLTRDSPFPEVRSSPQPWTPLGPPGTFPEVADGDDEPVGDGAEGSGVRFP